MIRIEKNNSSALHVKHFFFFKFSQIQTGEEYHTAAELTVMSTLIMSPSSRGRRSGIPWHATLLTDVQMDLGKWLYMRGEG